MAAREVWRKTSLAIPITIDGWMLLKKMFELCLNRLEDRSPQEERDMVFKALPTDLKKTVMVGDSRRADREKNGSKSPMCPIWNLKTS